MSFLNDYKNAGGRVTTGSDSGFIYQTYGFGYILELEMLQEAGFHPLEVIRSATLFGAETLHEPKGKSIEFGILRPGLKADLVITKENPLQNFKTLYGTGAVRVNDADQQARTRRRDRLRREGRHRLRREEAPGGRRREGGEGEGGAADDDLDGPVLTVGQVGAGRAGGG